MTLARPSGADLPRVSVVLPTFNRAALLQDTVASILAQTFGDFELIIVDNLSADGTQAYVNGLADPRVRYLRHANHGVIAVNRNHGIAHARAGLIALCDDDDLWLPTKLAQQIEALDADPATGLCYTNASTFSGARVILQAWMMKRVAGQHGAHLLTGNFIPNSSVVFRRDLFQQCGGFDEAPELMAVEDYDMWLRMSRRCRFAYIDAPLLLYRVHGMAASGSKSRMACKHFAVLWRGLNGETVSVRYLAGLLRSLLRAAYFSLRSRPG
ncbi:glycosyltransferase family 2 protein [Massilia sp. TWP1-3-3]|uniref:glycosyltransferase family 2 protein n=1 Tax=Massilia sp. TWP1-3-3 TaxID=2804573 RepID=UPI003CF26298